ncbi:MAG: hypothetical protein RMX55_01895, partial [Planktomarina sp.]|nr:hypothetical protein [Planktomarina sp.]
PWTNDLADAAWLPVCSWDLPVIPIDCGAAQPDWDSGSLYAKTKSFFLDQVWSLCAPKLQSGNIHVGSLIFCCQVSQLD